MKYEEIKKIVRKLRGNQTKAEKILWNELRNRKLDGIKFLRQHAIIYEFNKSDFFFFIPDFYCAEHKLVIELDGKIHDFTKEKDYKREMILYEKGIRILRFKNEEIQDFEKIKERIKEFILTHPLPASLRTKRGN